MSLAVLRSVEEVLAATRHDPSVRSGLREPLVAGWSTGDATAWVAGDSEGRREPVLTALGPPPLVAALLVAVLPELPRGQRVTLPRGTAPLLPPAASLDGTDWDFRWLREPPPPQPGESAVVPVPDELVGPLLEVSSDRASARPGDAGVRRWVGVTGDDGALVACAADTSARPAVGHLSSIAVHPGARGRGLGSAVTAWLTRRLLADGCDIVTLGMYADNVAGRAMYDRLGYRDEHRFTSGLLQVPARA